MAVLISMEFEASVEDYDKVNEILGDDLPGGLILHSGVDLGGKMKVVDIWKSAEDFQKFATETLGPAVGQVMGEGGPAPSAPEIQEIHDLDVREP